MGLFGGREYYVSSATFRMIEAPQDAVQTAVMNAIAQDGEIAAHIIDTALLNGMSQKVDRMYRFAKDRYDLGLGGGATGNYITLPDPTVAEILKIDLGITDDVKIDSDVVRPLTIDILLMNEITKSRGYYGPTAEISIFPPGMIVNEGEQVYLTAVYFHPIPSMQADLTYDIGEWVQDYGTDPESPDYGDPVGDPYFVVRSQYFESFTLPDTLHINEIYCIVKYSLLDGSGEVVEDTLWWYYRMASEVYSEFKYKANERTDAFLPVVPIRYSNQDLTAGAQRETTLYNTSRQMLDIVNIDIDQVAEGLNANPDINDIDHAYVTFGINLQDDTDLGLAYLVEYFDQLHDVSVVNESEYTAISEIGGVPPINRISLGDDIAYSADDPISLIEHGLYIEIEFDYIISTTEIGSIGEIGTATKEVATFEYTVRVDPDYAGFGSDFDALEDKTGDWLILKLQITETQYKEVRVRNLTHINNVYPRKYKKIISTVSGVFADPDERNFLIPIHIGVAKSFRILDRNMLYEQSFVIVISSIDSTHTAWYESSFFGGILVIVGMVLYASGWLSVLGAWLTEIGFAALAFVVAIVESAIIAAAIGQILSLISNGLSADIVLIIQVIYTLYTIYTGTFLAGAVAVAQTYESYTKVGLDKDLMDLESKYDLLGKEMDDLEDQLGMRADYDPLLWNKNTSTTEIPAERADAFKIRTGNTGNLALLDIPHKFHDFMKYLPSTDINQPLTT